MPSAWHNTDLSASACQAYHVPDALGRHRHPSSMPVHLVVALEAVAVPGRNVVGAWSVTGPKIADSAGSPVGIAARPWRWLELLQRLRWFRACLKRGNGRLAVPDHAGSP